MRRRRSFPRATRYHEQAVCACTRQPRCSPIFSPLVVVQRPADPCARTRHAPSPRGINYTRLKPVSWRNSWLKLKLSLSLMFSPFLAVDVGKNKRFLREQPGISSCRQVLAARLTSSPANIVHSRRSNQLYNRSRLINTPAKPRVHGHPRRIRFKAKYPTSQRVNEIHEIPVFSPYIKSTFSSLRSNFFLSYPFTYDSISLYSESRSSAIFFFLFFFLSKIIVRDNRYRDKVSFAR